MLKNVVTDCGTDINKKPVSITVFRGSCFNDFYRHFRKLWIKEKKTVAVDTKLRLLVKILLTRVVFQGNFIQVGRVIRRSFFTFSQCCSFHCQRQLRCLEVFYKKGFHKYLVKFTGQHLCQSLFLVTFHKKEAPAQWLSSEFWQILQNTYFAEHLWTAACGLFRKICLDPINNFRLSKATSGSNSEK